MHSPSDAVSFHMKPANCARKIFSGPSMSRCSSSLGREGRERVDVDVDVDAAAAAAAESRRLGAADPVPGAVNSLRCLPPRQSLVRDAIAQRHRHVESLRRSRARASRRPVAWFGVDEPGRADDCRQQYGTYFVLAEPGVANLGRTTWASGSPRIMKMRGLPVMCIDTLRTANWNAAKPRRGRASPQGRASAIAR